jgi:biopolymer transport protein ExbD
MKFKRKSNMESKISTSSMPDIIFMLLIFFMVTTVLREYSGLPISLPKAERIEKLESKRHTAHIWVSKDGLISIEDKLFKSDAVRHVMYEKRASDPQLTVSLKADLAARMEVISSIHNELRKADALRLNYSTKVKAPSQ